MGRTFSHPSPLAAPHPVVAGVFKNWNYSATCELKPDGTVVCYGGELPADFPQGDIASVHPAWPAFAALRKDGRVISWGHEDFTHNGTFYSGIETATKLAEAERPGVMLRLALEEGEAAGGVEGGI